MDKQQENKGDERSMTLQMLVSTMYQSDYSILKRMNIQTDAIVVNQCDKNETNEFNYSGYKIKWISTTDRGLSKSRNLAIKNATSDIIIFADDDFVYLEDYAESIKKAYTKYNADIIVFNAKGNADQNFKFFSEGKLSKRSSLSVNSIRITAKRQSLLLHTLAFDEKFGTGAQINHGEDTIFMSDCCRNKLNIFSVQDYLCYAMSAQRSSSWFNGFTKEYFYNHGMVYRRMSKLALFYVLYFAIRKYKLYKKDCSFIKAIRYMLLGIKNFNKEESDNK